MAIVAQTTKEESRCKKHTPTWSGRRTRNWPSSARRMPNCSCGRSASPLEYIDHPTFHARGAEKSLFGEDAEASRQEHRPFRADAGLRGRP